MGNLVQYFTLLCTLHFYYCHGMGEHWESPQQTGFFQQTFQRSYADPGMKRPEKGRNTPKNPEYGPKRSPKASCTSIRSPLQHAIYAHKVGGIGGVGQTQGNGNLSSCPYRDVAQRRGSGRGPDIKWIWLSDNKESTY